MSEQIILTGDRALVFPDPPYFEWGLKVSIWVGKVSIIHLIDFESHSGQSWQ